MTHEQGIRLEVERSLRHASDRQLVRVMRFIDRLPARRVVEDIVERVRGRLAMVRPARPLTVPRVLTLPLEDLLVDPGAAGVSPWVVPRPLLSVVHAIVLRAVPQPLKEQLDALAADRTMDDRATVLDIGDALWPAGAAALRAFLRHGAGAEAVPAWNEEFRPRLEGIAQMLEQAPEITHFLDQLPPRPMGRLRDDEAAAALSLLATARQASDTLFRCCYTMLMRRSVEPTQIFGLLLENDFGIPIEQRDRVLADAARECLHEIDAMNDGVSDLGGRSVTAAADATLRLVALIESLENAPSAARVDTRHLAATKARASQTIMDTLEASLGGEMRQTMADIAGRHDVSDDEVAAAENVARCTRKIGMAGARLGLGRNVEAALGREVAAYRNLLLGKLRSASARGGVTMADIMDELRLIEIVFGPEAAIALAEDLRG
ncbi:MAG TPA: hypothetical protein VGE72_29350 [Azospirillum sp.]